MTLTKSQKTKVKRALDQHEKFRKSYCWSGPFGNGASRSAQEKRENWTVQFKNSGNVYQYESHVDISCSNFYYRGIFTENGVKKDVRLFKNL